MAFNKMNIAYVNGKEFRFGFDPKLNLSEDKTVFHHLKKRFGEQFPSHNSDDDSLYFFGDTPDKEIKKGTRAGVILGLMVLREHDKHCAGFNPEIKYTLVGEVEEQWIGNGKVEIDGSSDLNNILNNCSEAMMIIGYRRNEEGGYTRPPAANETRLEYLFSKGTLAGVDAYKRSHHGIEKVIILRNYRDIFASLVSGYRGAISPKNIFNGSSLDEKGKRDETFDSIIPTIQIDAKVVVDELLDKLYLLLVQEHDKAVRKTLKHEVNW